MVAWQRILDLLSSESVSAKRQVTLPDIAEQARRDWLYAQNCYKTVSDPDLVDYFAYLIKAYERRYMYLLRKAREEGICCSRVSMSGIHDEKTVRQWF